MGRQYADFCVEEGELYFFVILIINYMNELNDLFTSSLNQTNLINKKLAIAQVAGMIYAQGKDLEEAVSAARQIVEKVYA